jgi:hypothetical protein
MLKELRAMNAQIHGTMFASYGQLGDLTVTGDVIVGDIDGIFTKLTGWSGVIQFDDQSDVAGPDNAAYIIPGIVDEGDIGGGNHAWRADLLFYGMEWTAGGDLPWQRMTSVNQYHPGYGFIQWGFGPSSNVWLDLDEEGFITSKKEHRFDGLLTVNSPLGMEVSGNVSGNLGLNIWNSNASGYGNIEMGGPLGAYIDFKYAYATDYDMRLRLTGTDQLTLSGGALNMDAGFIKNINYLEFSDIEPWKISIHSGDWTVFEGATNRFRIYDDDVNGGFKFYGNTGTNIVNIDNNDMAVIGGIRAGSTAANITDGYLYCNPTTTGLAINTVLGLASGSTYYIIRNNSSRRYKDHISYNKQKMLADLEIKPATFWRDDDQEWFIGLIAEDLAEEDYRLASYVGVDGSAIGANGPSGAHVPLPMDEKALPDNIQTSAVLAVLGAKANRADDRWVEQQAQIDNLESIIREITHGIHK